MLRRSFVVSGVLVATAGAAHVLKPRPDTSPSKYGKLETLVPLAFSDWTLDPYAGGAAVVNPSLEKVLNTIYSDQLARTYVNRKGERIMLSLAYGRHQSRDLQVHKPEVCYVAQGFQLKSTEKVDVNTNFGQMPSMRMVAKHGARIEPVTYWIRVGDQVIRGWWEQNRARVDYGLRGLIPDGLLVRVSSIDTEEAKAFELQAAFLNDMLLAISDENRPMFIGVPANKAQR